MRKISILLIEPDRFLGKLTKEYLLSNGYQVNLVSDGQKAIDYLDQSIPDIIILELQLIGHSGYEFLYELRSYKEWTDIPVIILSSIHETNLNINYPDNLGIKSYLYKPDVSFDKLNYIIQNSVLAERL